MEMEINFDIRCCDGQCGLNDMHWIPARLGIRHQPTNDLASQPAMGARRRGGA